MKIIRNTGIIQLKLLCLIRAAEQLLSRENLSITDIALQTGFTSITTFNRAFKKINSCTPSEFKKLHFNNSIGDIFG